MELSAPNTSHSVMAQLRPVAPVAPVQRVAARAQADGASLSSRQDSRASQFAQDAQAKGKPGQQPPAGSEARDRRARAEGRDPPAGPPPTFEISLLELAHDFERIIARRDRARTLETDLAAIGARTEGDTTAGSTPAGAPAAPDAHDAPEAQAATPGASALRSLGPDSAAPPAHPPR